ncbi:MAG: hypothetical protein ACK5LN_14790 [Propioniciclava sp.]
MRIKPLTEMAEHAESWAPADWWRLELRSFQTAAIVQRDLALLAPQEAVHDEYRRVTAASCLQALAYLFALVGPTMGAVEMLGWALTDGRYDLPLAPAGVLTGIALAVTGYGLIRERQHPRALARSALVATSLTRMIPAAITSLIALTVGRPLLTGESLWWLMIVIADFLVHLVMLVRGATPRHGPQNPIENLQQAVDELPEPQRLTISADRNAAIDLLRDRSLIDAASHRRAITTAVGMLGLTMAPEVRSEYGRTPQSDAHHQGHPDPSTPPHRR